MSPALSFELSFPKTQRIRKLWTLGRFALALAHFCATAFVLVGLLYPLLARSEDVLVSPGVSLYDKYSHVA